DPAAGRPRVARAAEAGRARAADGVPPGVPLRAPDRALPRRVDVALELPLVGDARPDHSCDPAHHRGHAERVPDVAVVEALDDSRRRSVARRALEVAQRVMSARGSGSGAAVRAHCGSALVAVTGLLGLALLAHACIADSRARSGAERADSAARTGMFG